MKAKKIIIGCVAAAAAVVAAFFVYQAVSGRKVTSDTPEVYVNRVSSIMGGGSEMKFAGVVEPQKTWDVKLQNGKTVKEVLVAAGDEVSVGTPLFNYDTDQSESELAQTKLDAEKLDNDIANYNAQVTELTKERDKASADNKLEYTTQIQEAQMNIKKAEYDKKSKETSIAKLQNAIDHAQVTSEIAGVVKSVGSTDSNAAEGTQNSDVFISILTTGEYRIKGTVNEQNISSVTEGNKVLIRSRTDSAKIWKGTMGKVDTRTTDSSATGNTMYAGTGQNDTTTTSTNYPFYVTLDSSEGLMLGQHVYIENDYGQDTSSSALMLSDAYIVDADSSPYVWADDGNGKLIKKSITLGTYNENLAEYEVTEGLTSDDMITFPQEGLEEGMTVGVGANQEMGLASDGSADTSVIDGAETGKSGTAGDYAISGSAVFEGTAG